MTFYPEFYSSFYVTPSDTFQSRVRYKRIYVRQLRYEWEGGGGIWAGDLEMPATAPANAARGDGGTERRGPRWHTFEGEKYAGWYWTAGLPLRAVNFGRMFRGKQPGDEFDFRLVFVYACDGGPEITQTIRYRVEAVKGKLRLPGIMLPWLIP